MDEVAARLRRIEGQVAGIRRMVEDGRPSEEILDQVSSARSALEAVACLTLERRLKAQLRPGHALAADAAADVMTVVRRFTKAV